MAQPTSNGILKFLFKAVVLPIIVIVLILGIGVAVLGNMTPAQLKIADLEFAEGTSIRSMGFADTKIFDLIKMIKDLFKEPNLADIVTNPPVASIEGPVVTGNLGESSASDGGIIDYLDILENQVTYDNEYLYDYNDTTIAYLMNMMIGAGGEQVAGSGEEDAIKAFNDLSAKVEEMIIDVDGETRELRFVTSINVGTLIEKAVEQEDNAAMKYALKLVPSKVYLVSEFTVSADDDGKLIFVSKKLKINDQENQISQIILGLLSEMIDKEGEGSAEEVINKGFGDIVSKIVGNLGKVGTATADPVSKIVSGGVTLGSVGIVDGKFTVITYTTVPE